MNKKEYSCKYCGIVFNHYTDVSRHYKQNLECYNKWKQDKECEYNSKTRVKCEICGVFLRNISNTHLKTHGITQQEYKERFPTASIFSAGLLELQNELREKTIKERFTTEEIKTFRGAKSNNIKLLPENEQKIIYSEEYKKTKKTIEKNFNKPATEFYRENINKFIRELKLDENLYKEHFKQRLIKRIKTNIEKYGVAFPQSLEKTKIKQKETLIKHFGSLKNAYDIISSKSIESRFENYGRINYCPIFSLESQNLFKCLEDQLKDQNYNIYYAVNGKEHKQNEYQILIKDGTVNIRFLDFYIKDLNKAIEFDEDYHESEKQRIADDIRHQEIIRNCVGIKIYRVKEVEWKSDRDMVIKKCLDFIQNS